MPRRTHRSVFGLVFALAALLMASPVLAAKVYQWKDAKGVTHFSDSPPPDQQGYKNRQMKDGSTSQAAAAAEIEDPACTTARKNLEQLKTDKPVGLDANGDGKMDKEMTAEERAQQVQLAELTLKSYCTKSEPTAQAGTR